jgi:hypothetical protein
MSRTSGLLGAAARGARWGLPWLIMVAIAASAAYAVTMAVVGAPSAGDAPTTISATEATAQALVTAVRTGSVPTFTADTTCLGYLGGGNPGSVKTPEMTAPPAWCRQ